MIWKIVGALIGSGIIALLFWDFRAFWFGVVAFFLAEYLKSIIKDAIVEAMAEARGVRP